MGTLGWKSSLKGTHGSGWTDERIAELTRLRKVEGLSASQIAKQLGGVTRNAVLGKLDRLGLGGVVKVFSSSHGHEGRKAQSAKTREGVKRAYRFGAGNADGGKPPEPLPDMNVAAATDPIPLLQRSAFRCAWPLGEPHADMLCCGAPIARGSYCAAHGAAAYVGLTARQRDADKHTMRLLGRAA